jgi:hypothetical protein
MRWVAKLAIAWNVSMEDEIWYAAPTQKQEANVVDCTYTLPNSEVRRDCHALRIGAHRNLQPLLRKISGRRCRTHLRAYLNVFKTSVRI